MATDYMTLNMPGNRLHHFSEVLAEMCYNGRNYYKDDKAEEVGALVKGLFRCIEQYILKNREYRTPTDSLPPIPIRFSRAMANAIVDFGNKLVNKGDFIDALHNVPIDVTSTLNLIKNAVRMDKIRQVIAEA